VSDKGYDEPRLKPLRILGRTVHHDDAVKYALLAVASVASVIVLAIIGFILANSIPAIEAIGLREFFTGDIWRPTRGHFGASTVITGTLLVTLGAIVFALPLGLGAAIFISELAPKKYREPLKLLSEIFSGIPSVVYGFFGLVVVVPFLLNNVPGATQGQSWLAGSILLGIMALPTIISVSEDAISSVPRSYREASLAMGATRWQTTSRVVVPAAISGISAATILGIGRAIGETMAVMMVTGNAPIFPEPLSNLMSPIRTITATLAIEMNEVPVGSTHFHALFLLALILFLVVLLVNSLSRLVMRRMKEKFNPTKQPKKRSVRYLDAMAILAKVFTGVRYVVILGIVWIIADLWFSPSAAIAITAAALALMLSSRFLSANNMQRLAHSGLTLVMAVVLALLVIIVGDIVIKGIPALSVEFITDYPARGGRDGGIYPAIVGTLKLVFGTVLIAVPLGVISGIYLADYAKDTRYTRIIRASIDNLAGTPSVVFGLFGLAAFVIYFDFGFSLLAGWLTLAFLVMPVIIRTTEEAVKRVPSELKEASLALGASKWETITKVVLPAAFPGVITGSIISIGRAAGETAPIMFTAVVAYQTRMGGGITDPVMALPYHLYYLATNIPDAYDQQYGTALVLLLLVLAIYASATVLRHHYNKKLNW